MQIPKGFVLDEPKQKNMAELPQGFVMDQPKQKPQGFFSGVGSDLEKRAMQLQTSQEETAAGRQTPIERELQELGTILGGAGDVVGRGMGAAATGVYNVLPEGVQQTLKGAGQELMSTRPAQAVAGALGQGMEKYQEFAQESPRAARNVEALANIGLAGAPALRRGDAIGEASEGVGRGVMGKFVKPENLNSEDLRRVGGELFKQADQQGAIMMPNAANKFFSQVGQVRPQTAAGRATAGDNAVTKLLQRWEDAGLKNKPLTFTALKEMDEELGRMAFESVDGFGKMTNEGRQFLDLQTKLRDTIENASASDFVGGKQAFETAKEARKYWSTQMRLRDIERIIERGLNAEQPATSIKSGFNTLLNSKRFAQYSKAEQAAIRNAAKKGSLVDFLGAAGSRLNQVIMGSIGASAGGAGGALAGSAAGYAMSAGARGLATTAQLKKARFVEDLIRKRVQGSTTPDVKLTPEIMGFLKEIGITQMPAGGVSELMNVLEQMQNSNNVNQGANQ